MKVGGDIDTGGDSDDDGFDEISGSYEEAKSETKMIESGHG